MQRHDEATLTATPVRASERNRPVEHLSPAMRPRKRQSVHLVNVAVVATSLVVVAFAGELRWSLARSTPWQCDEIPMLVRFTGLCGHVTNEQEARDFEPSFYSFYMGALRSFRAPTVKAAIHTTTGFWANLTTHLLGVSPGAGRLMPFLWSILAIGAAGWGGWMVGRSVLAMCVAICLVAFSPHAMAFGAQARGYAEAMALAPMLLIALEYLRRRPDRWLRSVLVLGCAIQLSLTVYTLWVYWVAPILLLALLLLPRLQEPGPNRRTTMTVMLLIAVSVFFFMTLFTIDRWRQLAFTASHMGIPLDSPHAVWTFFRSTVDHLFALPSATVLLSLLGLWVMWRSPVRWWIAALGFAAATPALIAAMNGSAGYPRNFGYLVVPLAILAGAGAEGLVIVARGRFRLVAVSTVALAALVGGSAWGWSDLGLRTRGILLPDWGGAVLELDRRPETTGPRWFCHSLANHWQINWYRDREHADRCLEVPYGRHLEVILGTQRDEAGDEILYQSDAAAGAVVPRVLPSWIAGTPVSETLSGVAIRRWKATRINAKDVGSEPTESPMMVLVSVSTIGTEPLSDVVRSADVGSAATMVFKPIQTAHGVVWSGLVPTTSSSSAISALLASGHVEASDIHCFTLTH